MEKEHSFKISTLMYRYDYAFNASRSQKKLPVYPSNGYWTFTLLSIFINELHDFVAIYHGYQDKMSPKGRVVKFKFGSFQNPDFQISIIIFPAIMTIVVKMSKEMLTQEFSSIQKTAISYFGLNQKLLKKIKNYSIMYTMWFLCKTNEFFF